MDSQTFAYYEQNAEHLALKYERTQSGLAQFFPLLFKKGQQVLDIGAGTGRDCALLEELGVAAWGLEPTPALRAQAMRLHPDLKERLFLGSVPNDLVTLKGRVFDGIILNAVLMHIPNAELFDTAMAIRLLLRPGGTLLLSFCTRRDSVDSTTNRDEDGRLFLIRSRGEVELLFERIGFRTEGRWESADALARAGIEWATLELVYVGSGGRPIDRIESIINRDRKTATYKFALLRAIAEIAMLRPGLARMEPCNRVSIPLDAVAELWVRYYWLIVESPSNIEQNRNGRGPICFRQDLGQLIERYRNVNGLPVYIEHVRSNRVPPEISALHRQVIRKVKTAITTGPVAHAGNGEFSHAAGMLIIEHDLWRELVLMGHWICDSVILRWAELTSEISNGRVAASEVVDLLLKTGEAPRTDNAAREVYRDSQNLVSAWSGNRLVRSFELDHIIPFSLRRDSSLWNLVPASRGENNDKRDRLPAGPLVRGSRDRIIDDWRLLREWQPERFRKEAMDLSADAEGPNWESPLFTALLETIEYTATLRGVPRWAGPAA